MAGRDEDRILNPNPGRHYRRTYSLTEFRIGMVLVAGLVAVTGYVWWKGQNPDPSLFAASSELDPGSTALPERERAPSTTAGARTKAPVERGPVPDGLALEGWVERAVTAFPSDEAYVKINGRVGFYQSFGLKTLYHVALEEADGARTVDIELYDLGSIENAVGCWSKERQPEAEPVVTAESAWHLSRNAMFVVRGRYYARTIGGDETPETMKQLERVRDVLVKALPGEPLPWAYALFVAELGLDAGKVAYLRENAFSLGFARGVYTVEVDADGGVLFAAPGGEDAKATTAKYAEGFLGYGEAMDGGEWVKDRFLDSYSTARPAGALVVGAYRVADRADAAKRLDALAQAAAKLPAELVAAPAAGAAEDGERAVEETETETEAEAEPTPAEEY